MPALEREQRPERFGMIGAAGAMIRDHRLEESWREQQPAQAGAVEHQVESLAEAVGCAQPGGEREGEAVLGAPCQCAGELSFGDPLEDPLPLAAVKARGGGEAEGEFHQSMIEKRHPGLDPVGHAHLVLPHQDGREIALEVVIKGLVER